MRLAGHSEYTIAAFSKTFAAVCRFRKNGQKFRLTAHAAVTVSNDDRAAALKSALRAAGGIQGCLILTGEIAGGGFFRCPALPVPGLRERREALEFELPRNLMQVPEDPVIQFMPADSEADGDWNVYAFPEKGFLSLPALLGPSRCKADELIHPLLAVMKTDPAVRLPLLEQDFVFADGAWRSGCADTEFWKKELAEHFILPDEEDITETCMECLLVMRLIMSANFREHEKCVRILPAAYRPGRLRFHLTLTVLLLLLLSGLHLKDVISDRLSRYREYQTLLQERNNYRNKTSQLKTAIKKREKEHKELQRVLETKAGTPDLLTPLSELCTGLPADAMVTSLRFGENSMDLVIQSASSTLNVQQLLRRFPGWKIGQLNQRTLNNNVTVTTVRFVYAEDEK